MKKIITLFLGLTFILLAAFPVKASEYNQMYDSQTIEVFENGDYIDSVIEKESILSFARSSSKKSARKTYTYKSSSGKILWTITVIGTFTYNGSSSSCIKASVSTTCPAITFKLASKTATKHNATAIATASFKQYNDSVYLKTVTRSVSLTCDKDGKLK